MRIAESLDQWTPVSETIHARIWDGKVWRKDFNEAYYGGYQIKFCLVDSRIGREWLRSFGHADATCSSDVVNFIDPTGVLRRAGLLMVV